MTVPLYSGPQITIEQGVDEIEATLSQPVTEVTVESTSPGLIEVVVQGPQGPRGEAGEPGAKGDKGDPGDPAPVRATSYVHSQVNVAAESWLVQHNLGFRPGGVHVSDLDGNDVEPVITHLSDNVLMLQFFAATAGTATLS